MFGLTENTIKSIHSVLEKHETVKTVLIFGSRAKGNYQNGSDIDLAIEDEISEEELQKIQNELEDLDLLYEIDIVSYKNIKNTPLGQHIDRVKKLFYKKQINNKI
jgi:predicted nucleotidyltransferase